MTGLAIRERASKTCLTPFRTGVNVRVRFAGLLALGKLWWMWVMFDEGCANNVRR